MAENEKEEQNRKSGLAYSAGLVLFFSVATLAGLGLLLDKWFQLGPWFAVGGIVLGTIVGFYQFFRIISRLS
jgi:F0F1-type ATP synthase assembly protein I